MLNAQQQHHHQQQPHHPPLVCPFRRSSHPATPSTSPTRLTLTITPNYHPFLDMPTTPTASRRSSSSSSSSLTPLTSPPTPRFLCPTPASLMAPKLPSQVFSKIPELISMVTECLVAKEADRALVNMSLTCKGWRNQIKGSVEKGKEKYRDVDAGRLWRLNSGQKRLVRKFYRSCFLPDELFSFHDIQDLPSLTHLHLKNPQSYLQGQSEPGEPTIIFSDEPTPVYPNITDLTFTYTMLGTPWWEATHGRPFHEEIFSTDLAAHFPRVRHAAFSFRQDIPDWRAMHYVQEQMEAAGELERLEVTVRTWPGWGEEWEGRSRRVVVEAQCVDVDVDVDERGFLKRGVPLIRLVSEAALEHGSEEVSEIFGPGANFLRVAEEWLMPNLHRVRSMTITVTDITPADKGKPSTSSLQSFILDDADALGWLSRMGAYMPGVTCGHPGPAPILDTVRLNLLASTPCCGNPTSQIFTWKGESSPHPANPFGRPPIVRTSRAKSNMNWLAVHRDGLCEGGGDAADESVSGSSPVMQQQQAGLPPAHAEDYEVAEGKVAGKAEIEESEEEIEKPMDRGQEEVDIWEFVDLPPSSPVGCGSP